jgi:hypothetical protein
LCSINRSVLRSGYGFLRAPLRRKRGLWTNPFRARA